MKKLILVLILIVAIVGINVTALEIVHRVDFVQTETCAGTVNENASGTLYVTYNHKDGSISKIKIIVKNCYAKYNDIYVQKEEIIVNSGTVGHFRVNIRGNAQFVMDSEYIYRYGMHFEPGETVYIATYPERSMQPRTVILSCEFP